MIFPPKKGDWIEESILTIMAELDGLIKGVEEFTATDDSAPPAFDRDHNNVAHGEYLGKLQTALVLVRDCLR